MVLIRLRIESAVAAAKVSAQSPPCNQNALPSAAFAIMAFKLSHSPANTNGGSVFNSEVALINAVESGHAGCCAAGKDESKRVSIAAFEFMR